ncbi:MAG: hypothetical protein IPG63_11195 [Xanthomonadales bacterium]|nr:hypothetical protein [Xanthomonadales bacterium]
MGERILTDTVLIGKTLLVSSYIPIADGCVVDGRGYINALDAFTGTSVSENFFDVDGDGEFDDDVLGSGSSAVGVGSVGTSSSPGQGLIISDTLFQPKPVGAQEVGINNPANRGRISWRELIKE